MLIWHIATTICDYKTPLQDGTVLDENQLVATTLSYYCSYLLFYVTELVMENFHSTQLFLQDLQVNAQQCLVGCRSKDAILERLSCLKKGDKADKADKYKDRADKKGDKADKYKDILAGGAKLADQLMQELPDKAARWELLAEVWVEKLISVTPSNNLTAHTNRLATGGEYITHLWVWLTHKGVLEPPLLFGGGGPVRTAMRAEELV
ncbi:hypothetical protein BAE44_0020710 [Dichanthelium oligosanthes]|uniref:DUF4220 domain-containing protein n=1 Tax=Dichanthelium oligosanthes TaxID=888268 RepID=A0A1E5UZH1_9POAL|nr:hypothetical protein BAE44_0020710 [Dichanthelium oligosanthes]